MVTYFVNHQCNVWCRPAENIHGIAGYGPLFADYIGTDCPVDTMWGQALIIDSIPAEAPPDTHGQPATIIIGRFINGAHPEFPPGTDVNVTWSPATP